MDQNNSPHWSNEKQINNKLLTARSPEIFAPARMPVAAGKNIANTEKKVSSPRKSGPKFSENISAVRKEIFKKSIF